MGLTEFLSSARDVLEEGANKSTLEDLEKRISPPKNHRGFFRHTVFQDDPVVVRFESNHPLLPQIPHFYLTDQTQFFLYISGAIPDSRQSFSDMASSCFSMLRAQPPGEQSLYFCYGVVVDPESFRLLDDLDWKSGIITIQSPKGYTQYLGKPEEHHYDPVTATHSVTPAIEKIHRRPTMVAAFADNLGELRLWATEDYSDLVREVVREISPLTARVVVSREDLRQIGFDELQYFDPFYVNEGAVERLKRKLKKFREENGLIETFRWLKAFWRLYGLKPSYFYLKTIICGRDPYDDVLPGVGGGQISGPIDIPIKRLSLYEDILGRSLTSPAFAQKTRVLEFRKPYGHRKKRSLLRDLQSCVRVMEREDQREIRIKGYSDLRPFTELECHKLPTNYQLETLDIKEEGNRSSGRYINWIKLSHDPKKGETSFDFLVDLNELTLLSAQEEASNRVGVAFN